MKSVAKRNNNFVGVANGGPLALRPMLKGGAAGGVPGATRRLATTRALPNARMMHHHNHSSEHVGACGCPCSSGRNPTFFYRGLDLSSSRKVEHFVSTNRSRLSTRFLQQAHRQTGAAQLLQQASCFSTTGAAAAVPSLDDESDYAFEMAGSNVRYGEGVTREIGLDMVDMGAKHVIVFTDPHLRSLPCVATVLQSLQDHRIRFTLYDQVKVEPTDKSFQHASRFVLQEAEKTAGGQFDAVIAVGGGSVMDTAKAANLYSTYPPENFLDYVNPPIGKGLPPPGPLKPFIAVPTTAGTGSEATGVAIFDLEGTGSKTGIAHRRLKPTLALVDPNNARTMTPEIKAASGFDVLCHALESYTAIPFNKRTPRPKTPLLRPAYQGSNPIADVWSLQSLGMLAKYFFRSVEDENDSEARSQMMLAATFAGIGFGSAGVHLCHGMSYPVSSMAHKLNYVPKGYPVDHPMVPHGMSVVLHAPAVFRYTANADPARHLQVARLMGATTATHNKSEAEEGEAAGELLAERIIYYMQRLKMPRGLTELGVRTEDIPKLVQGTLPQHRVLKLAPLPTASEELTSLFHQSMSIW